MHVKTKKIHSLLAVLAAGTLFWLPTREGLAASPQRNIKQGNRLYEQGDFKASKEKYMEALTKKPESDIINFNLGTALYKALDYNQALDHFQKALLSEDSQLKEKAYYNSGNTLYQMGMAKAQEAVEQAVASLEKSLNQYERALEIDRKDEDALNNHAFVEKELKRLKEKMQDQQQQQKSEQNQKSDGSQDQKQQQNGEQKSAQDQGQSEQQKQSQQQQQEQPQSGQQQQQQNEQQQGQQEQAKNEESQQEQNPSPSSGEGQEQQKDANGQSQANAQELTKQEAQMLLENYQQTEEPQGLLNIHQKIQDTRPVTKDW